MPTTSVLATVLAQRAEIDALMQSYLRSLAELDASQEWRAEGYVSVERCVAARTGAAMGAVCSDVALARRLYGESELALPRVAAAVDAGEITLDHARVIERETRFLDAAIGGDVEAMVVSQAKRLPAGQIGQVCDRARRMVLAERQRADELALARAQREALQADDLEALRLAEAAAADAAQQEAVRLQQERDSRYARRRDLGRMTHIEVMLPTVEADVVWSVVTPLAQPHPMPADDPVAEPDPRSHAQRFADAFVMLASRVKGVDHGEFVPGPIATISVIAEVTELDEVGYLARGKALSPAELERLCCDSDIAPTVVRRVPHSGLDALKLDQRLVAMAPALGGTRFEILEQGRSQRRATAAQKKALRIRDRGCVVPGCTAPFEWTEAHHSRPWSEGGETNLDDLASVCSRHHHQIHAMGWRLRTDDRGASWWVERTARPADHSTS